MKAKVQSVYAVCAVLSFAAGGEGMEAPVLGEVTAACAARTASTLSATVSVELADLGGAESVTLDVTATPQRSDEDCAFLAPPVSATAAATETGVATVALEGLIPGLTHDLRVVATGANGQSVTNETTSLTVPSGYTKMCYRPSYGKDSYPWGKVSWWYDIPGDGATVLNYLPSLGDDVLLYSSKNVDVPLTVKSGVHAETKRLMFNNETYANRQWLVIAAGGTLTNADDVILGSYKSTSAKCAADVTVQGDWMAWKNFDIGRTAKTCSSVTVEEGGTLALAQGVGDSKEWPYLSELRIGCNANGSAYGGVLTNRGAVVAADVFIGAGDCGSGYFENAGSLWLDRKFTIARNADCVGVMRFRRGATFKKTHRTDFSRPLIIGHCGKGKLIVEDVFAITNEIVDVGNNEGAEGEVVVAEGGVLSGMTNVTLAVEYGARGTLAMRGGTVAFPGGGGGVYSLFVGTGGSSSWGTVRGWGGFAAPKAGAALRLTTFGRMIADGEGVERDLDFGWFRTPGYENSAANKCGTNGWYAVNGGRLRLPHQQNYSKGSSYTVFGDHPAKTAPTLVNSFALDTGGWTKTAYIHADLYATDRSDIPAGLAALQPGSETNVVLGVLRAGCFTTSDSALATRETAYGFGSGKLSWSYDQSALDAEWTLHIYRHDGTSGGSWRRVCREAFDAGKKILTTAPFAASADDWNVGWFALVAGKGPRGFGIIVR